MSSVLVCVQPARGHVGPTKPLVAALLAAGHDVAVVTGARYEQAFADIGADVTVLDDEVDFDETDLNGSIPGRAGLRGPKLGRFDLATFAGAMPGQLRAVDEVLARGVDVVLCDPLFAAGMALVLRRDAPRVLVLGFVPLTQPTPYRPAPRGLGERLHGAALRRFMGWMTAPARATARRHIRELVGVDTDLSFMDWPMRSDGVLQMTSPGFEYPRPLPAPVHFIGPTTTSSAREYALPEWWDELGGERPVVHVTQGTIANGDLGRLVDPAIEALADDDVLVVVTTGGAEPDVDPLPANVRVADFLPYDELLPRCDLMITNGGYGGVNHALRHGVPLVVVGASEDKSEVAARVTWSGAGLGYARGSIPVPALRSAARRVLSGPSYRRRAGELAAEVAAGPAIDDVVKLIVDG
ncbi:UDP:flavonoid glycosyltransferase YjiC (YdhE family) [Prauserella sediminis]|uniref:UDP:flavonoid glycosyltransferase YjiC (YdhE family) n=1 Tax=Prauserella sediminis TaxID=577680 RepID=A0A839XST3_9PSEU|nr:glycosyltransferase [Prauserella sediminis]MBB3663036.1 UDP:flavonoid glycosyltransferase YjiC (YdhE family) [Prauserella sediminis]